MAFDYFDGAALTEYGEFLGRQAIKEIRLAPRGIEALEIIIIRLVFSSNLPTIEELVYTIKEKKNNDLNINIDNNELGNDLKKILDIFPESKLIKK